MEVTQEKWTEITVTVDTKDIETAGNIANMVVPYGIYIEDYSALEEETMEIAHIDLIEASLLQKGPHQGHYPHLYQPGGEPGRSRFFLRGAAAKRRYRLHPGHGPVRHGGLGKQLEKIFSPHVGRRQAADPPHLGGRTTPQTAARCCT